MSLLIKALKKAEQSKEAKAEASTISGELKLELAPIEEKPEESAASLAAEAGLSSPADPQKTTAETGAMSSKDDSQPQPASSVEPQASSAFVQDDIAASLMEESGFSLSEEAGFSEPPTAKAAKPSTAKVEKLPKPAKPITRQSVRETPAPVTSSAPAASGGEQRLAAQSLLTIREDKKPARGNRRSLILGLSGLILLLGLGGGFYYYLQLLDQPQFAAIQPPPNKPAPSSSPAKPAVPNTVVAEVKTPPAEPAAPAASAATIPESNNPAGINESASNLPALSTEREVAAKPAPLAKSSPSKKSLSERQPAATGDNPSMNVSRLSKGEPSINATQLAAYQAFKAGDDVTAGRLYRQVLQNDPRNVDALLGLAAVVARQDRNDEAVNIYQNVLQLDPGNNTAQAGLVLLLAQVNPTESESRLKTLIAQQPDAAYLHATLGGVYADQNRWPDAQQAYFRAFSLDSNSAEYAYNLAVSLDQLKKPDLALTYYHQALALLPKQGGSVDRAVLENRISQLQSATAN